MNKNEKKRKCKKENVFSDTSESNMFDGCSEIEEIRIDNVWSEKTLQNANQIMIDGSIKKLHCHCIKFMTGENTSRQWNFFDGVFLNDLLLNSRKLLVWWLRLETHVREVVDLNPNRGFYFSFISIKIWIEISWKL